MTNLILHSYDASPFTQKALLMLGLKNAEWGWVETPMMPPKPELVALTGGYRGTPVLQIGADIYIDSQRIACELDRRIPEPALLPPGVAGLSLALVKWSDHFFRSTLAQLIKQTSASWDQPFLDDRQYLFKDFDFEQAARNAPHAASQFRAHASLLNSQLADGRAFLTGDQATLCDIQAWPFLWIARAGLQDADELLGDFQHLAPWEDRVAALGEGHRSAIPADQALAVARDQTPSVKAFVDPADPLHLAAGQRVSVEPEDTRRGAVEGELLIMQANELVIRRHGDGVGEVLVHFPRLGYTVTALD